MAIPHIFFGTLREHYILLFGAAGSFALVMGFVGSWIGGFVGARRALRVSQLSAQSNVQTASLTASQTAEMMQALDAIALEVERISEAQRFTARVLSERVPTALPRSEPRSITPH